MNKLFKILPPTMPNFIRFQTPPGKRQDGFKIDEGYDIANFDEEEAKEFAKLMYDTFMKHWQQRKENSK